MAAGDKAIIATQKLSTGKINNNINNIPTPVKNIIKSVVLNNPNISILFFEFAGIKYEFI